MDYSVILLEPMQPVRYNPGISGFVKAHRHRSGASLVMAVQGWRNIVTVFWTKRLHHNARPYLRRVFSLENHAAMDVAERIYQAEMAYGPPVVALRDFQRERVYSWENETIFPLFHPISWLGCKRFVNHVWSLVGHRSTLMLTNKRRFSEAVSLGGAIHLPDRDPFFRSKPVILHEIAHELTPNYQHGPEFVGTYIALCDRFLNLGARFLEQRASDFRITVRQKTAGET